MYINCHSYFSLGYGTLSVKELVLHAVDNGIKALGLTDINNTSGIWEFIKVCRQHAIKPLVGIDFKDAQMQTRYIGIAMNTNGIEVLNRHLSHQLIHKNPSLIESEEHTEDPSEKEIIKRVNGMLKGSKSTEHELTDLTDLTSRSEDVVIIYPFHPSRHYQLGPNEYIGIRPDQVNQLYRSPALMWTYQLVLLKPLSFIKRSDYKLHLLQRAIYDNQLITKLDRNFAASPEDCWMEETLLKNHFAQYQQILKNTLQLIDRCNIEYTFHQNQNKATYLESHQQDAELLEKLALDGFTYRYGNNRTAMLRLLKELRIINEMNFAAYYLINWDMVKYAESKGYFYVGRGSGANSMVAYCLKITDVDPIELDLYFERFLNRYRTSPPDFDIDFSHKDRDDIYRYLFEKYGHERVALLGSYVTFQQKAAVRELGKVFGLPKEEIDQIVYHIQKGSFPDKLTRGIYKYSQKLIDLPKHLGIHASGVLISEKPIYQYSAMHRPPKGLLTVQFDMYIAEDIGLYKFDVLSQRGLSHIKDCIDIVNKRDDIEIDIHDVKKFKEDPEVSMMIRSARTIGCFYIESPAMRVLLTKLRCSDYLTLVAASSIIRPGVASSGMMRAYIERFHKPDSFQYPHPKLKELLEETYGVMVYQEDVIKVAHHFAGLGLDEADVLRRGMSGKFRSREEMLRIKNTFMSNCAAKGYEEKLYKEVWRQIESFSGYSFSKAHSASYAVESYQSLYLRTHYPLAFITAVLNNFGGFYRSEFYFHEARRLGAEVESICINSSIYYNRLVNTSIYVGFVHVKDLEYKNALNIIEERNKNGLYTSFENFLDRIDISYEQLSLLIRLKAFRFTEETKATLLWRAVIRNKKTNSKPLPSELFVTERKQFELPDLSEHYLEDAYDQIEILGFPLYSPFDLMEDRLKQGIHYKDFKNQVGERITIVGYLVTIKNTSTKRGERMHFGCFLDQNGDFFDTVHFPPQAKAHPFRGKGLYRMIGKVTVEFDAYMLEIDYMEKIPFMEVNQMVEYNKNKR